jgi:hypothetical protein
MSGAVSTDTHHQRSGAIDSKKPPSRKRAFFAEDSLPTTYLI